MSNLKKIQNLFVGIIPVRKGSKSIKNKNLILINQKPLVEYTFKEIAKSKINKSILLIGDSQPLPRYVGNTCTNYFETFLYKLKKKYKNYDFLEVVIGGGKLSQLLGQVSPYYGGAKPNLVIIFGPNHDARV